MSNTIDYGGHTWDLDKLREANITFQIRQNKLYVKKPNGSRFYDITTTRGALSDPERFYSEPERKQRERKYVEPQVIEFNSYKLIRMDTEHKLPVGQSVYTIKLSKSMSQKVKKFPLEGIIGMIGSIIEDFKTLYKDNDLIQIRISAIPSTWNVQNQKLIKVKDFNLEDILTRLESILQSNDEHYMDEEGATMELIDFNFVGVRMPEGGAWLKAITETDMYKKKGVIQIKNDDNICLARAIVVAKAKIEEHEKYEQIRKGRRIQDELANKLHEEAGVMKDLCGLSEISEFARYIDYNIVIVEYPDKIVYKTEMKDKKNIYILKTMNHYDTITSIKAFLSKRNFCEKCMKGYEHNHSCEFKCNICLTEGCKGYDNISKWKMCNECNRKFPNDECFNNHKQNKLCDEKKKCITCAKTYKGEHKCGYEKCRNCKELQPLWHKCEIKKKAIHEPSTKYVFFDFEANQETGIHIINHSESQYFDDSTPIIHKNIEQFCEWALGVKHKGYTFIAHNARGYDCQFVLKWLIEKGITPFVIYEGGKIMMMSIGKGKEQIRFIDSLSFLTMPLSDFPDTFGLTELKKGYFPHFFNKTDNQTYIGKMPDKDDYGYNSFSKNKRDDFLKWYDEQKDKVFDFNKEMIEYCHSDVDILRRGCIEFREQFMEFGIDPFQYTTIASTCMALFKANYMPEDSIAVIPTNRTDKAKTSRMCVEWLAYREKKDNAKIQHGLNGKEKILNLPKGVKAYLDGYDEKTKTAYEFHGCYWHGCPECFNGNELNREWSVNKTFGQLYKETKLRETLICQHPEVSQLITIWGCQWNRIRTKEEFKGTIEETLIEQEAINPRHAMFGGRVNALSLYWKSMSEYQYAKYIDVCSLYPTVMYYDPYPVKHHQAIRGKEAHDMLNNKTAFGIAKIKILPPRGLIHPVLPCQDRGKMMYYLCNKCGKEGLQDKCQHTDEDRILTGTWATPLIYRAIKKGYKLIKTYELWHWNEQTTELFKEYIKTFLRVKQESSGYPSNVITEEDKDNYIKDYEEKMKIKLDKSKIEKNEGRRAVAKLCLNSLWGKFGQQNNKTQTRIVRSEAELFKILNDKKINEVSINVINKECLELSYNLHPEKVSDPYNTNICVALFTTAHAQMRLYDMMDRLGNRVLYHDTDSVIYSVDEKEGQTTIPTGDLLGQWTDELVDKKTKVSRKITTFVGAGPKSYGYILDDGTTKMKLKGFSMNYETCKKLNLVNMFSIISNGLKVQDTELSKKAYEELEDLLETKGEKCIAKNVAEAGNLTIHTNSKITRNKNTKTISSEHIQKIFSFTYTKRVIQPLKENQITTLPYGY